MQVGEVTQGRGTFMVSIEMGVSGQLQAVQVTSLLHLALRAGQPPRLEHNSTVSKRGCRPAQCLSWLTERRWNAHLALLEAAGAAARTAAAEADRHPERPSWPMPSGATPSKGAAVP